MTTIASVADVHIGNHRLFGGRMQGGVNQRCYYTIHLLGTAVTMCEQLGVDIFNVAGDLFDTDLPSPAVIASTIRALAPDLPGVTPAMLRVILNGNHDMTSTEGDHTAVAPLSCLPGFEVHEMATVNRYVSDEGNDCSLVSVPHHPGPAKDWLPAQLGILFDDPDPVPPRLLSCHLGIEHEGTPPWLRGADDSIHVDHLIDLCVKHGIGHVVAGNWHGAWETTRRGVTVRQIGALVPTGFDNPGVAPYGRVVFWRANADGTAEFLDDEIVAGPRFHRFTSLEQVDKLAKWLENPSDRDRVYDGCQHYVSVEAPEEDYFPSRVILDRLKADGHVGTYKMSKPASAVREQAERAAKAAANAESLGEALFDYVVEMDLDDQAVDRQRLHQECRRLLKL